jgi:hypothetical protein
MMFGGQGRNSDFNAFGGVFLFFAMQLMYLGILYGLLTVTHLVDGQSGADIKAYWVPASSMAAVISVFTAGLAA